MKSRHYFRQAMGDIELKRMRDVLISGIHKRMFEDERIFFISADLGSPALDKLRADFKKRFINVGIAEQNLVNISAGLALEGFTVYAYAIAAFLTMRAYEQIRANLALAAEHREINVNLIGVGAGVSYDMSGPSHHSLEDLAIMRTLPNIMVVSPSDWVVAGEFVDFSIRFKRPKYIRLDGKPLPRIYGERNSINWQRGFNELARGGDTGIVSTGYMTHKALKIARKMKMGNKPVGIIDIFMLKFLDEESLFEVLRKYKTIITLEEGFTNCGGLDSLIRGILGRKDSNIRVKNLGFKDKYIFKFGDREFLSKLAEFSEEDVLGLI